jgi:arylsulfatase A-like enzyme
MRIATLSAVLAIVSSVLAVFAWTPRASTPIDAVVVITLDTTRADRLSPYGLMDAQMPTLDRFAREGVLFRQALTVAPLTLPAHASLMTGLFPASHGVRDNADEPLRRDFTTLAERLQGSGFATGAFVGSAVLNSDRGLAQGFGVYDDVRRGDGPVAEQRSADRVVDEAIGWLGRVTNQPFFLWVHLYDAHLPYEPREPFRSRARDPYVAELLFVDAQIGRLREALERSGRLDRAIIVLAGDHGEGLGDHGEAAHGELLYDSVMHVPLIMRVPGVEPREAGDVVRLVDVMPTVLDLLQIRAAVDGTSLAPILRGGSLELEAYAETLYPTRWDRPAIRALRGGRYKLIRGQTAELYDLERDPFEERNLSGELPRIAELMQRRMRELAGVHRLGERLLSPTPEVRARLAALGYAAPGAAGGR